MLAERAKTPRFPPPPKAEDPAALSRAAQEAASRHGFVASGVLGASAPVSWRLHREWLDAGNHGEMAWLERDADARLGLDAILPYCASVLSVARAAPPGGPGNVARYARGEDYHRVVRRALQQVAAEMAPLCPVGTHFRVCVDTAPLLEREIAARCGVGFLGKNGMLIVPGAGSHVVLGELLTDVAMTPTAPLLDPALDECGACTACLDACPTRAFLAPRLLDARRCLSYLTIEKRTPFTPGEEAALGGRLFGCDDCQDVCPWNSESSGTDVAAPPASLDPESVATLSDDAFQRLFSTSAIRRATREGLVRNARAALRREKPR
jgi:epoxyqueuosine reductase